MKIQRSAKAKERVIMAVGTLVMSILIIASIRELIRAFAELQKGI